MIKRWYLLVSLSDRYKSIWISREMRLFSSGFRTIYSGFQICWVRATSPRSTRHIMKRQVAHSTPRLNSGHQNHRTRLAKKQKTRRIALFVNRHTKTTEPPERAQVLRSVLEHKQLLHHHWTVRGRWPVVPAAQKTQFWRGHCRALYKGHLRGTALPGRKQYNPSRS